MSNIIACWYVPRLALAALDLAEKKYLISEAGGAGRLGEICVQIGQLAS